MRGRWDTVARFANTRLPGYPTGRGRIALPKHFVRNESRFQPRKLSGLPQATHESAPLALSVTLNCLNSALNVERWTLEASSQRLVEILDQIVRVFETDRQAQQTFG